MNETRVQEILNSFEAFKKEAYYKDETLSEMFKLQDELVRLTFNDDHASTANLKLWDVEKHFEQLNHELGNVADEELDRFLTECKEFSNKIKAEVSGNRGEARAFSSLQYLSPEDIVLKNVELTDGVNRTELDAVVISKEMITIVEVKNTAKNIFIDENGDFYRTGEYLRLDCNIAERMRYREHLLREILAPLNRFDVQIRNIIVFTDNNIEVQNKCTEFKTCFVSQLPHIINSFYSDMKLSETERSKAAELIREADAKEAYVFKLDVNQLKNDFAILMAKLEEASIDRDQITMDNSCLDDELIEQSNLQADTDGKHELINGATVWNVIKFLAGVASVVAPVILATEMKKTNR